MQNCLAICRRLFLLVALVRGFFADRLASNRDSYLRICDVRNVHCSLSWIFFEQCIHLAVFMRGFLLLLKPSFFESKSKLNSTSICTKYLSNFTHAKTHHCNFINYQRFYQKAAERIPPKKICPGFEFIHKVVCCLTKT